MQEAVVSVSGLVGDISTFFTEAITWVGDVAEVVSTEPLLIIMCIAVPVVGLGVGLLNRMIRL